LRREPPFAAADPGALASPPTCSVVAKNIRAAFLDAQKAIKAGDAAAVEKARNAVQTQLFANYVQVRLMS
jgi:hypothetical protein